MIARLAFMVLAVFAAPVAALDIKDIQSPGGIQAWLVEEHSIPFTALEIQFRGGASLDLPGKRGATNLAVALIEEGAGDLDARAFARRQEELAASFSFNVYDDSFVISARFLTERLDESIALLRLALTSPRFDQDALDRVRGQVLSIIRSDATDEDALASAAFDAMAFPGHPYGTSIDGTLDSVGALTQEDVRAAFDRLMAKDRVFVGASGDVSADQLAGIVDALFADLPDEGPALPTLVDPAIEGGVTVIKQDTPQSKALFGHVGIARDAENYLPAYILFEILGGSGFDSRLMQEVREKRGLTYGVSAFLVPKRYGPLVLGSVASANDRIAEAIDVIQDQWADIATNGVSAEELDAMKTYLTGSYPLRFDGNDAIAGILVGMQAIGLDPSYIADRNALIEAVTLDEINAVAATLLRPDDLHFVVVGQPEGLEQD